MEFFKKNKKHFFQQDYDDSNISDYCHEAFLHDKEKLEMANLKRGKWMPYAAIAIALASLFVSILALLR